MNLGQIIETVDGVKPNAFQPEDKVRWLNELERLIQTDVWKITDGFTDHVWADDRSGPGLSFPDDGTLVIPGRFQARAGGVIDLENLTDYAGNEAEGLRVRTAVYDAGAGTTTLTVPEGSFSVTGTEPETGEARLYYDGLEEPMLAPEIWEKIYPAYLEARIAWASGEFTEYSNLLQMYNAFMAEYIRWYCRTEIDD